jgi:hypothetical protein
MMFCFVFLYYCLCISQADESVAARASDIFGVQGLLNLLHIILLLSCLSYSSRLGVFFLDTLTPCSRIMLKSFFFFIVLFCRNRRWEFWGHCITIFYSASGCFSFNILFWHGGGDGKGRRKGISDAVES